MNKDKDKITKIDPCRLTSFTSAALPVLVQPHIVEAAEAHGLHEGPLRPHPRPQPRRDLTLGELLLRPEVRAADRPQKALVSAALVLGS